MSSKRSEVSVLSVPAATADVIFIRHDEPGASVFLQPGRQGKRPIAVLYGDEKDNHAWFLRRPATSTDLIPLLKSLQAAVGALPSQALLPVDNVSGVASVQPLPAEKMLAATPIVPTITGQSLLERLKVCLETGRVLSVQLDMNSYLVIDGKKKTVFVPSRYMEMQQTLLDVLVMFRASDYVELSDGELARLLEHAQMSSLPLEQFTWVACHHVEPQLPIPESIANLAFMLTRWPSFTRLRYKPVHMQWAGRLVKTASSMSNLTLGVVDDMIDAAKFYNACVVGGLVMVDVGITVAAATNPGSRSEKKGVFQRILQRLKK
ncbi:MAG: hypothetical protein PSX71_02905 [bacterium]|nr:hypothetical protein [bacterium]